MEKRKSVEAARNAIQGCFAYINSNWPQYFAAVDERLKAREWFSSWNQHSRDETPEQEESKALSAALFEQCIEDFRINLEKDVLPGIAWKKAVPVDLAHLCLSWNRSPVVLEFDNRLTEALQSSIVDQDVDLIEYLSRMPFSCFFVNSDHLGFRCSNPDAKIKKAQGFFVDVGWMPSSLETKGMEKSITITILGENGRTIPLVMPLSCMGFDELCSLVTADYAQATGQDKKSARRELAEDIRTIVNMLLYVASQEPDIEDTIAEGRTKESQQRLCTADFSFEDDPEPRLFYVGKRVGKNLGRTNSHSHYTSNSRKMAPHIRRAHFHTYVIGSKKDDTRKRVLRWLEPMRVNMDDNEDPLIMVRKVEAVKVDE